MSDVNVRYKCQMRISDVNDFHGMTGGDRSKCNHKNRLSHLISEINLDDAREAIKVTRAPNTIVEVLKFF